MTHFYEKNIVEIKNEYTTFIVNIMTPFLYEGLKSVYNYALDADTEFKKKGRNDPSIQSPGILKIFQTCLREIPSLNNHSIENETNRIKDKSKCSDWFDDLVKAVIKSNIVLLTFSTSKNQCELVNDKFHERIQTKDFVHKCLIESARAIYNNPELFWHEFPTIEIKRNQREICDLIKVAIKEAIRKMLPMKMILKEYLQNEYINEAVSDVSKRVSDSQYMNIKAMVNRDLHGKDTNDSLLEDNYNEKDFKKDQLKFNKKVPKQTYSNHGHDSLIDENDNGEDNAFEAVNEADYIEINQLNEELKEIENNMSDRNDQSNNSHESHKSHKSHSTRGTYDTKEIYGTPGTKETQGTNGVQDTKGIHDTKRIHDTKGVQDTKGLQDTKGVRNTKETQGIYKLTNSQENPFLQQTSKNKIDKEINDYLKQSEEVNSSGKLKEIHTETRNNISETDRSQFFAKYNV